MKRRLTIAVASALLVVASIAAPASARTFGAVYVDDMVYRVFGNPAHVPDGTGTDPFATFTNSTNPMQKGVAEFAPGTQDSHGGRWAVYRATFTAGGDASELVTSWAELQALVDAGDVTLVRDAAADFRCPVLGNPEPIG
jgi:hypothetical protein